MEEQKNEQKSGGFNPIGLCIGLGIGLCFGTAMGNMGTGICLGMGVGLCFSVALGHRNESSDKSDDGSGEEQK